MDSAALSARFRKVRPSKLIAISGQGERRAIAVPTGRRRKWDWAIRALEHLDWYALELLDEKDSILEVIDNRAGGEDGELMEVTPDAKLAGGLELMLRAQDVALARSEKQFGQLINGFTSLVQTFAERLASMERSYAAMLQMAREAAMRPESDATDELVKQFAPHAMQQLFKGKPTTVK